jgi:hypothetical protein
MMHRRIEGLKRAIPLSDRPSCIPLSKLRGAKAAGLRFERALHKSLKGSILGQWFEFEDALGHGYCQTDLLFSRLPDFMIVVECKYTLVPGAHSKLSSLYIPIVEKALGCRAAGVVVVKNLDPRYRRGRIFTALGPAAEAALESGYPTLLQWSGQALVSQIQKAA